MHSIHESIRRLYMISQGKEDPIEYVERFKNMVDVITHVGGNVGVHSGIILESLREEGVDDIVDADAAMLTRVQTVAKERYCMFTWC
jgi:hypothetical protein